MKKKENPNEYTVLEQKLFDVFMRDRGVALTREALRVAVGLEKFAYSNNLDVHIKNLRRKLPDTVEIQTVRGVGYRMN